ncbi:MAG: hypothetical protein KTR31_11400 [Myxococcales bacterium]|nr:hypothetical protein [Myxococcales bacterium]
MTSPIDASEAPPPAAAPSPRTLELARELGSLAVGLCLDAGIGLEVASGGWSFDPIRRIIRVSAEGLETEGPEYCAGIVAHEVGHFFISRYTMLPVDFPSLRSGRTLLNAIEDPRVDRWITSRYPGARPWQNLALVDEMNYPPGTPDFMIFCMECAVEGDKNWRPSTQELPEHVVEGLRITRDARRAYAHLQPPTDVDRAVEPDVPERYRDEVWPILSGVRWIPSRREQRVQLSAYDALCLAEDHIFDVAEELYLEDRRRIACWLASHPAHAGRGRRMMEQGQPGPVVAQALQEGAPDRPPPPWAEQLAQELLDGVVSGAVHVPMVVHVGPRPRGRPWDERVPELPPLPRIWRPSSDYDRAYADVSDQVDQLVQHLEEILRPRKRLRERGGHPTGRKVDLRRLMAFEADPRRYDELWVRTTIPDRRNAAIGLLVDLSGSMQGQKTRSALLGTILLAETLHRLEVPFAIDGFQDVLIPLHAFGETMGPATRQRISEIPQEVGGCRHGGNNQPGYNDDGPCLLEFAEKVMDHPAADRICIVVSDGMPEGRRSNKSDLHNAVTQLTESSMGMRLIALGLGPNTQHVRTFYPESVADVPLPQFAETIGNLVERVLLGED